MLFLASLYPMMQLLDPSTALRCKHTEQVFFNVVVSTAPSFFPVNFIV